MNKPIKVDFATLYPLIRDAIDQGKDFSFTAFGHSMFPYIKGGVDRVFLSPLNKTPKKGDVLFYRRTDGTFVLHRLIKQENDSLVFCGDNQFVLEKGIKEHQLIARLSKRVRGKRILDVHRLPSRLWVFFLPIRRFVLKGNALIIKILKKIGRMIHLSH